MSIWRAVMPSRGAGDLEVHVAVVVLLAGDVGQDGEAASPSETRPIATPATGALIGTPASISASVPPQTVAIDEEPLDSRMSETTRTVYGKSSSCGQHRRERAARPGCRGRSRGGRGRA